MELTFRIRSDDKHFENLVKDALAQIPKEFLEKLDNVEIVVTDTPNQYQINKIKLRGESGFLLGLYEGTPQTKRGRYQFTLPDKISIFKSNIERLARNDNDLKEIVKNTVWHEIAHHFGMEEEDVSKAEKKRRERHDRIKK